MTQDDHTAPPHETSPYISGLADDALATLLRNLTDAVVVADPAGVIVFWNDAATALFGWTAAHAIGQTLDLIIPERLRRRHWTGYETAMATGVTQYAGRVLEVPALQQSGEPLSIAFTVTMLARPRSDEPQWIAAVIRDDTARWHDHRALVAELEDLRQHVPPAE